MTNSGIPLGDLLADSGYAYRVPETWALPLRALGAQLVVDLHPNDRGPQRHPHGRDLLQRQPLLPRHTHSAARALTARTRRHSPSRPPRHDQQSAELARYKLSSITAPTPTATTA